MALGKRHAGLSSRLPRRQVRHMSLSMSELGAKVGRRCGRALNFRLVRCRYSGKRRPELNPLRRAIQALDGAGSRQIRRNTDSGIGLHPGGGETLSAAPGFRCIASGHGWLRADTHCSVFLNSVSAGVWFFGAGRWANVLACARLFAVARGGVLPKRLSPASGIVPGHDNHAFRFPTLQGL